MKPFKLLGFFVIPLALTLPCLSESEKGEEAPSEAVIEVKEMTDKEAAAVEQFRADLLEIREWLAEEIFIEDNAEARSHRLPLQMTEKLAAISTKGLPTDLTESFEAYKAVVQKQADLVKGMPEDFAEIMEWMAQKFEDAAFSDAQTALFDAQFEAESAFIEVASQYGAGTEADFYRIDEEVIELKEMTETEAAAVDTFKAELNEIYAWLQDEIWKEDNGEARAHRLPIKVTEKLAGVSTEGLPADLAESFVAYKGVFQKQAESLKGMPEDFAGIMEWMADKLGEPAFADAQSALFDAQYEAESSFIQTAASYGAGKEADLYRHPEDEAIEIKSMTETEAAAVEKFKTELNEIYAWLQDELWKADNREARVHRHPIQLTEKLAGVSTEGLPADLIESFEAYKAVFQKEVDLLKGMPEDFGGIMEWMAEKSSEPAFADAQSALLDARFEAESALIQIAASYGAGTEADLYRHPEDEAGDAP